MTGFHGTSWEGMASECRIRPMSEADVEPGVGLVMKVFHEFVAADLSPEGIASFAAWADPAALAERLRGGHLALVAVQCSSTRRAWLRAPSPRYLE